MTEQNGRTGVSRRDVLKGAGAGAGVMAVGAAPLASRAGITDRLAAAQGGASTDALQLARVWFDRGRQDLLAGFDDTHRVFDDGSLEILLWPGDLARLKETGLRFEITETDLVARDRARAATAASAIRTVATQPGETSTGDYRHLPDFEADLRKLAKDNPSIARLIELPYTTLQGRTVYGIEIAQDVNRRDGRPVFYNDGVHHAREWPAAEMPIMWAFDLIEGYNTGDERIRNIVSKVRNVIIPVVNPDGYNHSREFPVDDGAGVSKPLIGGNGANAITGYGQYVRKNRRSYLGTHTGDGILIEREKPHADKNWDVYGVDPNRNYAYAWGDDVGGSASNQGDQTYRGERPFSEAESKNVAHIFKTQQVTGMITHHTSGDLVLWAWGDTRTNAPDNTLLEAIGRGCAQYNGYTPQKSIDLYETTGTTSDYAYGSHGAIGYTFEHAGDSFHPEYTSTVPEMYEKNREALILLAEQMCLRPGDRKTAPPADMVSSFQTLNARAAADGKRVVPLGALNHCILRGRLVDAGGNGVAGEVKLFKRFRTPLWQFFYSGGEVVNVGNNPSGMKFWEEIVETVAQTAPDGTFELHCNPSTRPALFESGGRETWEFTARANGGGHYQDIYIERGEDRNLGDLQVG